MPRTTSKEPKRGRGRPKKEDAPRINYNELDSLLVFGEVVPVDSGDGTCIVYPTYRDIAKRLKVSLGLIGEYAVKHNCARRRADAEERVRIKADQKIVELRATTIALSRDDELRIIDAYLAQFEKALADGRVRFDSPADFNTMARLKEFIQGGADSRQEIHASLTLEDIQARYRRAQQVISAPAQERGEQEGPAALGSGAPEQSAIVLDSSDEHVFGAVHRRANDTLAESRGIVRVADDEVPPEDLATGSVHLGANRQNTLKRRESPAASAAIPAAGVNTENAVHHTPIAAAGPEAPAPRRTGPRWPDAAPPSASAGPETAAALAGTPPAHSRTPEPAGVPTPHPQNPGVSGRSSSEFAGEELAPEDLQGDEAEEEP